MPGISKRACCLKNQHKREIKRIKEGLCVRCGKKNTNPRRKCDVCEEKDREYQRRRRAERKKYKKRK